MTYEKIKPAAVLQLSRLASLPVEQAEEQDSLLLAVFGQYQPRLRDDLSPEDERRLAFLVAAGAFYEYAALASAKTEFSSVSMTDLSVQRNTASVGAAERVYSLAQTACADLFKPKNPLYSFKKGCPYVA